MHIVFCVSSFQILDTHTLSILILFYCILFCSHSHSYSYLYFNIFKKVYDVDNFHDLSLSICYQLPSCKIHQTLIDNQWQDPDRKAPLSLMANNIKNEVFLI